MVSNGKKRINITLTNDECVRLERQVLASGQTKSKIVSSLLAEDRVHQIAGILGTQELAWIANALDRAYDEADTGNGSIEKCKSLRLLADMFCAAKWLQIDANQVNDIEELAARDAELTSDMWPVDFNFLEV